MMLIFDGDCAFCKRVANFGKSKMVVPYETVSWQSIVKDLDKYGLSQEDVSQRVYWADGEKVLGGSKAVFLAGKCLKQPWSFISSFGLLPGMSIIAEPVYRLIARNRHRLPGSTDACAFDGQKSGKKTVLGLELFFGKDVQTKLEIESKNLTERNFSYKEVGASKGAFPSGYVKDAYSARIGSGERSFIEAVEKFKEFTCHKIAGLKIAPGDFRFEKNSSVYFGYTVLPFVTIGIADRIVYVEEKDRRFECAYGTLNGHPEKGEEVFKIYMDEKDNVFFVIECFSKIQAPLARLGYSVSRFLQKRITRKYISALK